MEYCNYSNVNFKQLYHYMLKDTFRMLICGNSGSGKTNFLSHIERAFGILWSDLFVRHKSWSRQEQRLLINDMNEIKSNVGYNVLVCSNNKILPVKEMQNSDLQNKAIFDDFATTDVQNQSNSIAAIFVCATFQAREKEIW